MKALSLTLLCLLATTAWSAQTAETGEELDRVTHDPLLDKPIHDLLADKPEDQSETGWLTSTAWGDFAQANYSNAVTIAAGTIGRFEPEAVKLQAELIAAKEPVPVAILVNTDEKRQKAFSRGALNDIAACYIILGECWKAQSQDRTQTDERRADLLALCKQAYRRAERYPHALVWDPSFSGFWSPAYAGHLLWRRACAPQRPPKGQLAAASATPKSTPPTKTK